MSKTPIKARFDEIEWRSESDAVFEGLSFYFEPAYGRPPPPGQVFVFKPKSFFALYADVIGASPTRNVLELGIWLGGSALVLASLFDVRRLVAIDICEPVASFDEILASHPLGKRISARYRTSQDDQTALYGVLDSEFDGPPDVIIDDASHLYGPSRSSFEILFPALRAGGWYVIEDWAWGHQEQPCWVGEPSLAGLIFELQLAWVCSPELIGKVVVQREMVFIQKAEGAPVSHTPIYLEALYTCHERSRPLVV